MSSAYQFLGLGATAIGPLVGGGLAQFYGVRAVLVAGGTLMLMMVLPFLRAVSDEALEAAEPWQEGSLHR